MPTFNPNLPHNLVQGAGGPAVYEQGGYYYERDGNLVSTPDDSVPVPVMSYRNPITGRVEVLANGVDLGTTPVTYVDARRYGIYGDNGDYSTKMQVAIDDLDSQQSGTSGMLILALPAGDIRISSPLIWKRCGIASLGALTKFPSRS